jgi:hypothetical protein
VQNRRRNKKKKRVIEKTKINALKFFALCSEPISQNVTMPPQYHLDALTLRELWGAGYAQPARKQIFKPKKKVSIGVGIR